MLPVDEIRTTERADGINYGRFLSSSRVFVFNRAGAICHLGKSLDGVHTSEGYTPRGNKSIAIDVQLTVTQSYRRATGRVANL